MFLIHKTLSSILIKYAGMKKSDLQLSYFVDKSHVRIVYMAVRFLVLMVWMKCMVVFNLQLIIIEDSHMSILSEYHLLYFPVQYLLQARAIVVSPWPWLLSVSAQLEPSFSFTDPRSCFLLLHNCIWMFNFDYVYQWVFVTLFIPPRINK